jgi:hypothetical protein
MEKLGWFRIYNCIFSNALQFVVVTMCSFKRELVYLWNSRSNSNCRNLLYMSLFDFEHIYSGFYGRHLLIDEMNSL